MRWRNFGIPALFGGAHRRLRLWRDALALYKVSDVKISSLWSWRAQITFRSGPRNVLQQLADGSEDAEVPLRPHATERFAEPLDVKSRLLHNARRHPKPAVRLYNLLALIREYPDDPDTLKVLRGACIDPISKVRVRAAIELGDEARGVLLRIAEISSDDASCALAVSHLGSTLPLERARDILARALRKGFFQMARACLEVLSKSPDPEAFQVLTEVLAREKGELAAAAARTLGATGSPAAEPPLLLALQREETDLRVAAANALGRIGSAVAVLPLREAAESADDPDLLQAACQAIAEIQSRIEGAAPGQLSLAEDEAGQLSLAEFQAGQLSLATDPAGQLSLPPDEPGSEVDRDA